MTNITMNPTAKNNGVLKSSTPPHRVPNQLKTFTPVGTAMIIEVTMNVICVPGVIPVVNMWWAQTRKPITEIAMEDPAIARYPKTGFLLKTGRISDTIPIAGRIMM